MALKSSLAAQYGWIKDVSYGTYQAPTHFIDFVSESLAYDISRVESKAIRANARVMRSEDWVPGTKKAAGDVTVELWNKGCGGLLELCFGNLSTSGTAAPYVHTLTPGDLPSATIQVGIPDVTGTVRSYSFLGATVDSWELDSKVGDPVTLKVSYVAKDLDTAQSLASASYPTSPEPLTFVGASLSVSGTSVPVNSLKLKGKNGLDSDRFFLGATTMSQPLEASLREYEGEFEAEFTSNTIFAYYTAGVECSLVATFAGVTNATHSIVITANVRFDGETPTVSGMEIVKQPMKFKVVDNGTTSIRAVVTTSDATL